MKTYKSLISAVLVLVMLLGMVPAAAMAAESTAAGTVGMQVTSASAQPGGTVDVVITVSENPGIASLKFDVAYDNCLTLTNVELGSNFGSYITTPVPYANPQPITVISPLQDVAGTGVLATLTFAVSADAEDGYAAGVRISHDPDDVFNGTNAPVTLAAENGTVFVYHKLPGDVNGDGKLNPKDPVALFRYVAGWPEAVDEDALDYNGDTKINTKDAIDLFRYVAGWEGIVGHRHVHKITPVAKKDATCTVDGNTAHYCCEKCGKLYSDEGAENEIEAADTVIPATKHAGYLQKVEAKEPTVNAPGNDAYWKCSLCGLCYSDEAAKNQIAEESTVIPAKAYYTITFMDSKNWPQGNKVRFAQDEALELTTYYPPTVTGYEFGGWYTTSTFADGTKLDNLPAGNTEDKTVYAKWDATEYTIIYKNAADNSNPKTYTVEDEIMLADPKWAGLKFSHWIDENGDPVTKIKKGTTGKLFLEACWIYAQNYAVTSENKKPIFVIKPDDAENNKELYYMVYEVGTVYNVPMDYISPAYRYDGTSEYSQTYSKTLNVGEASAQSAARSTGSSYVKTSSFTSSVEMIKGVSTTKDQSFKLCPEIEAEGVKVKMYEYENGKSNTVTETTATTESNDTGISLGGEVAEELAHSVSYYYDISTSVSETLTLSPGTSPAGSYRLAWVSDYRVYAIVTYDAKTGDYGLNIYSMALGSAKRTLYELLPEYNMDVKITRYDSLNYEIPVKPVEGETGDVSGFAQNIVNASFYVTYDANGGTGTQMPMSVGNADGIVVLQKNTYRKSGWHFTGWDYAHGETVGFISGDGSTITNPLNEGDTLVLKAHWEPNTYSVTYDANGGSGTTAISKHTYDTASALTTNGFSRTGYTFLGWSADKNATAATYANKASVKNLTDVKNGTVKLYAVWKANTYTVTFKANGGSGSDKTQTFTYDKSDALTGNSFTRTNYVFRGWSTSSTAITATYKDKQTVTNLAASGNVKLYAVWVKTTANIAFTESNGSRNKTLGEGETYTEVVSTGMDKAALIESGYTKIQITVKFDAKRSDPIMYNNAVLRITSGGTTLGERTWDIRDHFDRTEWTQDVEKTIEVSISDLGNDISFALNWSNVDDGTWSKSEEWYLGETNVTVTAK